MYSLAYRVPYTGNIKESIWHLYILIVYLLIEWVDFISTVLCNENIYLTLQGNLYIFTNINIFYVQCLCGMYRVEYIPQVCAFLYDQVGRTG